MTQETITFENKKYQWKNIPEYGKCLVPYKELVIPAGSIIRYRWCNKIHLSIITRANGSFNINALNGGWYRHGEKTIEELNRYMNDNYKNIEIIPFNELHNVLKNCAFDE